MRDVLRIAAPFTLWIAAFSLTYALEGLVCSRHGAALAAGEGRMVLVAAWLGAIAAQGALLWTLTAGPYRSPSRFGRRVSTTLSLAALVATIWTLMPAAALSVCEAG